MSGADGIEPLFRFFIDMGTDDLADKDYMVAGLGLRIERAFKIGNGIGKQDRIDLAGRGGFAVEFGQFIDIAAGP